MKAFFGRKWKTTFRGVLLLKAFWIIQKGVLPSHTGRLSCSKNIWPFKAASSEKKALWRPKHRPAGRPRQAMPTPLWKQSWEKFQWKQLDKERCCRCRTNEEGRCSVVLVQPSPTSSRQLLFWQTAKAFLVRGGAGNYTTGALRPKWGYHIKQWGCHSGAVEQNYSLHSFCILLYSIFNEMGKMYLNVLEYRFLTIENLKFDFIFYIYLQYNGKMYPNVLEYRCVF